MAEITANITVSGVDQIVPIVRREVAQLIEQAAAAEANPFVSKRLREVGFALAQNISHAEAVERMKVAPEHTGLPHRPTVTAPRALDVVAPSTTAGQQTLGKTSTR